MADKPKEPAKHRPPTKTREKPLSLQPLSFEEAVDKMLKAKPERTPPRQQSPPKAALD